MLSLIFSATVYTFSIILAVFLIGLGLAAHLAARSPGVSHGRRSRWAGASGLRSARCYWSAEMLARSLPYWPVSPSASAFANVRIDMAASVVGDSAGADSLGREFFAGVGGGPPKADTTSRRPT